MIKFTPNKQAKCHSESSGNGQTSNFFLHINIVGRGIQLIKMSAIILLMVAGCLKASAQNALHFTDSVPNDYVRIPNHADLNLDSGEFTIEAVVRIQAGNVIRTIVSKRTNGSVGTPGFTMYTSSSSGQLCFQIKGVNLTPVGPDLRTNTCIHVAVKRLANGAVFGYVNGVQQSPQMGTTTGNMSNNDSLLIGWDDAFPTSQFKGVIDEVRIWDIARTSADILAYRNSTITASTTGLKAYYRFDQGAASGSNGSIQYLFDATSGAHDGQLRNFVKNGSTSNFVAGCITSSPPSDSCGQLVRINFDSSCCRMSVKFTNPFARPIWRIKLIPTGGVIQNNIVSNPYGTPGAGMVTYNPLLTTSPTLTFESQSTTATGLININFQVISRTGTSPNFVYDTCFFRDSFRCKRALKLRCDTVKSEAFNWTNYSARKFTVSNIKYPASNISKILVTFSNPISTKRGKNLQMTASTYNLANCGAAGMLLPGNPVIIPNNWCSPASSLNDLCGKSSSYVKFVLGVPTAAGWTGGTVNFTIIHCDGDTCYDSHTWNPSQPNNMVPFTSNLKLSDSLFGVSLKMGLPAVKGKEVKWLSAEIISKNSEFFAVTGGEFEQDAADKSRIPLMSSWQSSQVAMFEFEENLMLDGSGSNLPLNMVFKGKKPLIRMTGYNEQGEEVIRDTFTINKDVLKVYKMMSPSESKIGLMAYPNPSASQVTLSYFIEDASNVEFTIYDITGTFISTYVQGKKSAGNYEFKIDNSGFAPGTYIVKMKTEKYSKSVIMIIAK